MGIAGRWFGRCLSPVLVGFILSACSQTATPPVSSGSLSSAVANSSAAKGSTNSSAAIAQQAPAQTPIATFQTQQRTTGFSTDGQYFVHLESWRDTGAGVPHAALQIVDLSANTCVANGCLRTRFDESKASQDVAIAENDLLQKTQQLRQDLKLNPPVAGTSLPVVSRTRAADGSETVIVRLQNQQPLQLTLRQKQGTVPDQAAMQLGINYAGKTRSLGSLTQMQSGTVQFAIQDVQQSADGKTIAVLLTAAERAFEGTLGRTLVQGFAL